MQPVIIIHGGAGDYLPENIVQAKVDGVKRAARIGYQQLLRGHSALDAVEAAIMFMEEDVVFNCGYGSVLNIGGGIEMDASIMRGSDLNAGAVTLVKEFQHPISIARKVLTDSPHVLLGGEGVKIFALEKGFVIVPEESLVTQLAKDALHKTLTMGNLGRKEFGLKDECGVGTVGAVALDAQGHIAAATSTGGTSGAAIGRISDTPQIGSGTYADDNVGGVSSTGHGDSIIKFNLSHRIVQLMEGGADAKTAAKNAVNALTVRLKTFAGAIAISRNGDVGVHSSASRMPWAYIQNDKVFYGVEQAEVLQDQVN